MLSKKKKIIIIGSTPPPHHGMTVFIERLLNSKIADKFDIFHLDTSDRRSIKNLGRWDVRNVAIGIRNFFQIIKLCIMEKPDIVYLPISQNIAYLRDGFFIVLAFLFSKAKIIVNLHGCYFDKYYSSSNWFMRFFIDKTLKRANVAVLLGESVKDILKKWIKISEIIPNGLPFDGNNQRSVNEEGIIYVSYLGNLMKSKGVIDLMQAMKIVFKQYDNVVLKLAGSWIEPEVQNFLNHYLSDPNVKKKVVINVPLSNKEKNDFLLNTDIFVFPTYYRYEAQPAVVIEAMAAGCPVISSAGIGVISETVEDGISGILVEPNELSALASAIIDLVENPEKRNSMGQSARKRYLKNYTIETNISNFINIFNKYSKVA